MLGKNQQSHALGHEIRLQFGIRHAQGLLHQKPAGRFAQIFDGQDVSRHTASIRVDSTEPSGQRALCARSTPIPQRILDYQGPFPLSSIAGLVV